MAVLLWLLEPPFVIIFFVGLKAQSNNFRAYGSGCLGFRIGEERSELRNVM